MSILGLSLVLLQLQVGTITGIVTKPGSNDPASGATVILTPVAPVPASRTRTTISEDDGRFSIRDIEPGDYRLQVQSRQYGIAVYGQSKPNGPGAILTIGAGQRITDVKISMPRTGAIAGRITGRSGEPIAHATVQALKYVYQDGRRILAVAQTTTTDDRGDYRLFWLNAGKYVVVAGPRSSPNAASLVGPLRPGEGMRTTLLAGMRGTMSDALLEGSNLTKRIREDGTVQEESWMPTYYPGTTDRSQASSVDLTPSSTIGGINIALGPSAVQRIRGRVSGTKAGTAVTVFLSNGTQGTMGLAISANANIVDGAFELSGVVPGLYSLTAQERGGLVSKPMAVLVGDRDLENLAIALEPAVTLSAQITIEGVSQGAQGTAAGLVGTLRADLDGLQGGSPTNLRSPSTVLFSGTVMPFPSVPPGDYQFHISQNSGEGVKPLYVKSIRLGREDALNSFHLSGEMPRVLDVVLTSESGSVEGVAIGRAGDAVANVTVALVPTNARRRMNLYQTLVTGSDGKFRFEGIPPGDYKLFAWEDIETGAWANVEFMRPLESRGQAVRISENSKEAVQLRVIDNP